MLFLIFACGEPKQTSLDAPQIQFAKSDVFTGEDLVVELIAEPEVQEGSVSYGYSWYVNGEQQLDLVSDKVSGDLIFGHQEWKVVVDASWEELSSQAQAEIVIANSDPEVDVLLPTVLRSNEDIGFEISFIDLDNDDVTYQSHWIERSSGERVDGDILGMEHTVREQVWDLTIMADDGYTTTESVFEDLEIQNAIPNVISSTLGEENSRNYDSILTVEGEDYEQDPLQLDIAWYVDDDLKQEGMQSLVLEACGDQVGCCLIDNQPQGDCASVLSYEELVKGAVLRVEFSLYDGIEYSSTEIIETTVSNAAPMIEEVLISPEEIYAEDVITCSYSGYSDRDDDADLSTIHWLINGQEVAQGDTLTLSDYGLVFGDVIQCTVIPSDGDATSEGVSVEKTLSNTPPIITSTSISHSTATEDDVLLCTADGATDADGHSVTYEYGWKVNGVDIGVSSDQLTGEDFDKDQTVVCYTRGNDGYELGEAVDSSPVSIINDIPFITGISVTPSSVTSASVLTCSYLGYEDSDPSDTDQTIIEWFSGTMKVGDGAVFDVEESILSRGDYITCSVTPNDGEDSGYAFTKTLVIYNALPQFSNVQLTPDPAFTNDTLEVQADIYDPEGDDFTIEYSWFVENSTGNIVQLSGVDTPYLDGSIFFSKGQKVYAEILVTDSYDNNTKIEQTPTITISNTPPPPAEIAITPQNTYADDDLLCSVLSQDVDVDGDPITHVVEWRQNGALFLSPQTTTITDDTVPNSYTTFLDEWSCTVYSVDDEGDSLTSTQEIDICPLGQYEECVASSCQEIIDMDFADPDRDGAQNDGLYWIDPETTGAFQAYCDMSHDDGGWTMLLSADGYSNYWGNASSNWATSPVDFVNLDASNPDHAMYFAPATPDVEDLHLAPYENLKTNEIRLCNGRQHPCHIFVHNLDLTLQEFFSTGVQFTEYSENVHGITDKGTEELVENYVLNIGREPYSGDCIWIGINHLETSSAMGFLSDYDSACANSSVVGIFDDIALGLGLQSCEDGNGCSAGWNPNNLAGQQRYLQTVGSIVEESFWVYGR